MILQKFSCKNWRCLRSVSVTFHPLANLICGPSDTGKTSLLKGIMWCLGVSTRIGSERDIMNGAEETEASLTIGLSDTAGATTSHTITRRLNRKGRSTIDIDGAKVSVSRALEIVTGEWGLPHPEQLVGMIWLRQLRLDALMRESAVARQDRFKALLGFHQLKEFNGPLDRVISQLNENANSERSLGVDPRELAVEIASVEAERARLVADSASFATAEQNRALGDALRGAVRVLEAKNAEAHADALVRSLPAVLRPWLADVRLGLSDPSITVPNIERIGDFSAALNEQEQFSITVRDLQTAVAEYPSTQLIAREIQALQDVLARFDLAEAVALFENLRTAAPKPLIPWIDAATSGGGVPAIERLADFADNTRALSTLEARFADSPAEATLQAQVIELERWMLQERAQLATRAADSAISVLPEQIRPWAAALRKSLSETRAATLEERSSHQRAAGIVTANVLCERSEQARQAILHQRQVAQISQTLHDALGANAPDGEARARLRQWLRLNDEVRKVARELQISPTGCEHVAGLKLRAALNAVTRASLAAKVPDVASTASATTLSPKAEQALRLLWAELEPVSGKLPCPLTGDAFSTADLASAKAAQAEREQAAFATAKWREFVDAARRADHEIAALLDEGNVVQAFEMIRVAKELLDEAFALAPATSRFWSDRAAQQSFIALLSQLHGTNSTISAGEREWLQDRATALDAQPEAFLDQVRALEDTLAKLGPVREVTAPTFPVAAEALVIAAQESVHEEDRMLTAVNQFAAAHGQVPSIVVEAATVDDATRQLAAAKSTLARIPVQRAEIATLKDAVQKQRSALFSSADDEARYAPIVDALVATPGIAMVFAAQASKACQQATIVNPLRARVGSLNHWDVSAFGPEPRSRVEATARMDAMQQAATAVAQLQEKLRIATAAQKNASDRASRLRLAVFRSQEQLARYTELIEALRTSTAVSDLARAGATARIAIEKGHALAIAAAEAPEWAPTYGIAPATVDIAQARLAALEKESSDLAALQGKIVVCDQSLARMRDTLARMSQRAKTVERVETIRDRFKAIERFLQPENGPRVLMSSGFLEIIERANEILEAIGADRWLVGDENFELFTGSPEQGDLLNPAEEIGGGMGNLCGIAMALGLLDHYNESTNGCGVQCMVIDEPTICVSKALVPSLLGVLTSKGRRHQQTILVEHEASGAAYVDHTIQLDRAQDVAEPSLGLESAAA